MRHAAKFMKSGLVQLVGWLALAGCTAVITKESPSDSNWGPGTGGPSGTKGGQDPGTKRAHLLNDEEYNNTLTDLLGFDVNVARDWVKGQAHGFDNVADVLSFDGAQYKRYFDSATDLARAVAERLGTAVVEFPSDHGGFLGGEYGQTGDPDAFAAKLRDVLG